MAKISQNVIELLSNKRYQCEAIANMMRLATSAWTMKAKPFTFNDSQVTEILTNIGELHQTTYNNEGKRRRTSTKEVGGVWNQTPLSRQRKNTESPDVVK